MERNINELIADVIAAKNKRITDEVFLLIQNDREFMQDYLRLVEKKGLDSVNQLIGAGVKKKYNLENDDQRNKEPKSSLIQSHQQFK